MTSRTDTQVQAGWYPDPLGTPHLRWWDGNAWTHHTADRRQQQTSVPSARAVNFADPEPQAASGQARSTPATRTAHGAAALPAGSGTVPELGWAGAALTLHSVQTTRVPMLIELGVAGHPAIRIDSRYQAYSWQLGLEWFPEAPPGVVVSVELVSASAPPPFELPGESLDVLLWKIGRAAFPDRLAPWLEDGEGYRLTRWPNWTTLTPDADQIRQTAMLGNAILTIPRLAELSGRSIETTRSLINALSLMGTLGVTSAETMAAATMPAMTGRLVEGSLFQRLREKFRL